MPQFKQSLSAAPTDFGKVRSATPTQGKGDVIAKGLGAIAQGAVVFGKASARGAGQEAALEQQGFDLSLEEVNTDVDNINSSIKKGLAVRKEEVGGELTQRQVQESKDKSLGSLALTDRHIQGLIDAGTITSTEGNARRRMALAQKMNEGSNFLFKDEFVNAMSSVTGGAKGSASAAFFPKTSEELAAENIAKAQNKAIAEYEEKVSGLMLTTGREREQVESELNQAQIDTEIVSKQPMNADDEAQRIDRMQALTTQQVEVNIAKSSVEGVLDPANSSVLKGDVRNQANNLRLALANTTGLAAAARDTRNKDIDMWETGMNTRIDSLGKVKRDKELLESYEQTIKIAGIEAFPQLAIIGSVNKDLATEVGKLPKKSVQDWVKVRTTGSQREALNKGLKALAQLSSGQKVDKAGDLTLGLYTETGFNDFIDPDSPNVTAWKRAQAEATNSSFVALRGAFAKKAANWDKDINARNKVIDHYNFAKNTLLSRVSYVGGEMPQIVLKPTPENIAGISEFHKKQFGVSIDISDELAQYPEVVSIVEQGYKTFKEHPWLWNEEFDNPTDGYNAFLKSGSVLSNGLEEPTAPKKETPPVKKQEPEEDVPLSVKHNNPGNLRSFGDVPTVDTPSGKFAKFKTVEEGLRALARDLDTKRSRGDNTIGQIISQYSPDDDPENVKRGLKSEDYIKFAEKSTGISRDKALSSERDVAKLMKAIIEFESGKKADITDEQIVQGIEDAKGS